MRLASRFLWLVLLPLEGLEERPGFRVSSRVFREVQRHGGCSADPVPYTARGRPVSIIDKRSGHPVRNHLSLGKQIARERLCWLGYW